MLKTFVSFLEVLRRRSNLCPSLSFLTESHKKFVLMFARKGGVTNKRFEATGAGMQNFSKECFLSSMIVSSPQSGGLLQERDEFRDGSCVDRRRRQPPLTIALLWLASAERERAGLLKCIDFEMFLFVCELE
jgi:hypothetical protein